MITTTPQPAATTTPFVETTTALTTPSNLPLPLGLSALHAPTTATPPHHQPLCGVIITTLATATLCGATTAPPLLLLEHSATTPVTPPATTPAITAVLITTMMKIHMLYAKFVLCMILLVQKAGQWVSMLGILLMLLHMTLMGQVGGQGAWEERVDSYHQLMLNWYNVT